MTEETNYRTGPATPDASPRGFWSRNSRKTTPLIFRLRFFYDHRYLLLTKMKYLGRVLSWPVETALPVEDFTHTPIRRRPKDSLHFERWEKDLLKPLLKKRQWRHKLQRNGRNGTKTTETAQRRQKRHKDDRSPTETLHQKIRTGPENAWTFLAIFLRLAWLESD